MTSRERLLAAFRRETPDRVPYCEVGVSGQVIHALSGGRLGGGEEGGVDAMDSRGSQLENAISALLGRDHVCYRVAPPIPAERHAGADGIPFYGDGALQSLADLDRLQLPDPEGEALWGAAEAFQRGAGERATGVTSRAGFSPVYLAMGMEPFAVALHENLALVEGVLERYTDWAAGVARQASRRGFDFFWTSDDLAFKTGPLLSPAMFRRIFVPHLRKVADALTIPWVFHSDGDLSQVLPDLADLGVAAINPLEPEAMDIVQVKKDWGHRFCLLGNVSVHLLAVGTPAEVEAEVGRLLREVAPGGGYVLSSGNSLASYCRPENVQAMLAALTRWGAYPISI
ncbi:MAG: hypothetical protein IT369_22005 [Candidatus Latescibacteria bacterium]|nr:hypothetical protein [Candidatus Latescibacterota bacterium]